MPSTLRICLVAVTLLATACTTSGVMTTGPGTYTLSATRCGLCAPVSGYVTQQATAYCATQHASLVVKNINGNNMQPMFPGSATITFSCGMELDTSSLIKEVADQCKAAYETAELDPIRYKVELYREGTTGAPPFAIAANDTFPTANERVAIEKWAMIRDDCIRRGEALQTISPSANALQVAFIQQDRSFNREVGASVSALIVALYQEKLTYGEFARKRYEIGRDGAAAELAFRQAALDHDQQRQMQAQQIAQQEFSNRLIAWNAYIQAVNARQPQTVHIEGSITVVK
jgi:hypothetical protein